MNDITLYLYHFTLKNIDKRTSTLKGLAPKKKQGTAKNIKQQDSDSDDEEDSEDYSRLTQLIESLQ